MLTRHYIYGILYITSKDGHTKENKKEMEEMNVQEIIAKLDELKEESRVRDWDYYKGEDNEEAAAHEEGFIWVEEIDKWVQVD